MKYMYIYKIYSLSAARDLLGPNFRIKMRGAKFAGNAGSNRAFSQVKNSYECLTDCKEEGEFYCNSFSYCFDKQSCIVTTLDSSDLSKATTEKQADCFLYSSKHKKMYFKMIV